jgi:hypothetical protein
MTAAAPANVTGRQPAAQPSARFLNNVGEWVFLTRVYGLSETDARERMGVSDKAALRYRRWLAANPGADGVWIVDVYPQAGEAA